MSVIGHDFEVECFKPKDTRENTLIVAAHVMTPIGVVIVTLKFS